MNAARILAGYRLLYVLLIAIASVQTLLEASQEAHVVPLACTEIAGAALLALRRTQLIGVMLLLCVFAAAQVLAALHAHWPTRFLQYAASAVLIVLLDRSTAARAAA